MRTLTEPEERVVIRAFYDYLYGPAQDGMDMIAALEEALPHLEVVHKDFDFRNAPPTKAAIRFKERQTGNQIDWKGNLQRDMDPRLPFKGSDGKWHETRYHLRGNELKWYFAPWYLKLWRMKVYLWLPFWVVFKWIRQTFRVFLHGYPTTDEAIQQELDEMGPHVREEIRKPLAQERATREMRAFYSPYRAAELTWSVEESNARGAFYTGNEVFCGIGGMEHYSLEYSPFAESEFQPSWASAPGETMMDILKEQKMSIQEFGNKMELKASQTFELLGGMLRINKEIAEKLSAVLGGSATFWIIRDSQYVADRARLEKQLAEIGKQHKSTSDETDNSNKS